MRRILRSVTTLSAVLLASSAAGFATGCSSSSDATAPSASQVPGTYSLRTINGAVLPYLVTMDQTGSYSLVSDAFTFNSDGTFGEQLAEDFTATGTTTATRLTGDDNGTWKLSGTNVVLVFADASGLTGAFTNGNTITFTGGSVTAVYQK